MAGLRQLEFFILRYVPDALREEHVNIGVVLRDPKAGEAHVRMTNDWARVRCIDPDADLDMLAALESDLMRQLQSAGDLKRIEESFSNTIQLSTTKALLATDVAKELEELVRIYLEPRKQRRAVRETRPGSARQQIVRAMRDTFEQAGVWDLMWRGIEVKHYGMRGDPLKIDCGYKPNGIVKMFHALALETDPDSAKVLAFTYPGLRQGIKKKHQADSQLMAIIRNPLGESEEEEFAMMLLRANDIYLATVFDLPALAEQARVELKA